MWSSSSFLSSLLSHLSPLFISSHVLSLIISISLDLFSLLSSPPVCCCCDVAVCVAVLLLCVCVGWLVGVVVWLVGCCCCVLCVVACRCVSLWSWLWLWSWCGVCGVACVVWHAETTVCRFKTPPCVHSKRHRVYRHHAHMCFNMCAWCQYTRKRFECTHGGVLDGHTEGEGSVDVTFHFLQRFLHLGSSHQLLLAPRLCHPYQDIQLPFWAVLCASRQQKRSRKVCRLTGRNDSCEPKRQTMLLDKFALRGRFSNVPTHFCSALHPHFHLLFCSNAGWPASFGSFA